MRQVYIVGKALDKPGAWEFQGVFTSEERAVAACASWRYFVGPARLDEAIPDESVPSWPGAYYPIARGEE